MGSYGDASSVFHGYLRARDGTFTTFDPPGSFDTRAFGINPADAITGDYLDAVGQGQHGFLRARDGTITAFDPPGSGGTVAFGINPAGSITGNYSDTTGFTTHGFLRARDGTITAVQQQRNNPSAHLLCNAQRERARG